MDFTDPAAVARFASMLYFDRHLETGRVWVRYRCHTVAGSVNIYASGDKELDAMKAADARGEVLCALAQADKLETLDDDYEAF